MEKVQKEERGSLLQGLLIAFAMYSRIPVPAIAWTEQNMGFCMAFFPCVGAAAGAAEVGLVLLGRHLGLGEVLTAVLLTLLPIALTGGIHMDGLMDTLDARHSYGSRERKLEILKDSRAGAFAVLGCGCYLLLYMGFWQEILRRGAGLEALGAFALGMVLERALSGLSVLYFPNARGDGTAAGFQRAAAGRRMSAVLLAAWLAASALGMLLLAPLPGAGMLAAALAVFGYYRWMSRREFGGITGDLAGYFLQLCELAMLAAWAAAAAAGL